MLKRILARGMFSYLISVTAQVVVILILGLCGATQVTTPDFTARVGNPLTAMALQSLLIGLIGFAFGAGSLLFEVERWSFLKQGAVHLTLTAVVWIGVELICFSPVTLPTVLSFAGSATLTYGVTWGIQYLVWRREVRRLNAQIQKRNEENAA